MNATDIITARGSSLAPTFEHADVAAVMRHGVISCEPESSVRDVARIMASYHIHAVVVGLGDNIWGVLTARDLLAIAGTQRERLSAGEVAATEFVTVTSGMKLDEASRLMREHDVDHVVVTDDGRPIGVLSTLDVAGTLAWGEA
jgi:CBS domain-containing protein